MREAVRQHVQDHPEQCAQGHQLAHGQAGLVGAIGQRLPARAPAGSASAPRRATAAWPTRQLPAGPERSIPAPAAAAPPARAPGRCGPFHAGPGHPARSGNSRPAPAWGPQREPAHERPAGPVLDPQPEPEGRLAHPWLSRPRVAACQPGCCSACPGSSVAGWSSSSSMRERDPGAAPPGPGRRPPARGRQPGPAGSRSPAAGPASTARPGSWSLLRQQRGVQLQAQQAGQRGAQLGQADRLGQQRREIMLKGPRGARAPRSAARRAVRASAHARCATA